MSEYYREGYSTREEFLGKWVKRAIYLMRDCYRRAALSISTMSMLVVQCPFEKDVSAPVWVANGSPDYVPLPLALRSWKFVAANSLDQPIRDWIFLYAFNAK